MEKSKKRERNVNFSHEETDKLLTLIEDYKTIVENKKCCAVTWKEKEKAWKNIETHFNSFGTETFRDAKHLKMKYEALKKDIRRKWIRAERDGVTPTLTPAENKVWCILLSIEGGVGTDDSDPDSNSLLIDIENPHKKSCVELITSEPVPSASNQTVQDIIIEERSQKDSVGGQTSCLQYGKRSALCKQRAKRVFSKLASGKLEIVELQKKIYQEELEERILKKQMTIAEMQHKNDLYKLEKAQMLLKIKVLNTVLDNKKNSKYEKV